MKEKIILMGFGGHAKSVIDSIESRNEYEIVGYTDVEDKGVYRGYHWLGKDNSLSEYYSKGVRDVFVTIGFLGNGNLRDKLYDKGKALGFHFPAIVDKSAIVATDAVISEGVFIGKNCVINAQAHIEKMSIINTGAIIEHENRIGRFSHIAVGVSLCGDVEIGNHCLIGAGSTVLQGCKIGNHTIIGGGSIVLGNVPDNQKSYGVIQGIFAPNKKNDSIP